MKKVLIFSLLLLLQSLAYSQLMIPVFEEPQKEKVLSDGSEESMPLTFSKEGEMNIFFNRVYQKLNENNETILQQDVWTTNRKNDKWRTPIRLFRDTDGAEINLAVGAAEDGSKIYLLNRSADKDSIYSSIVYCDRKGKNGWEKAVKLDIPGLNVEDPQMTFFMHSSGDVLLLSHVKPGSTSNEDLYVFYKMANGKWSEETHLGDRINTGRLEFSPFLSKDKKALYFASSGHKGFGESDIFVAYREGDSWTDWTRPLNLGLPINSSGYESDFMISDSAHVYFTSDRDGETADIFHTKATGEHKIANLPILAGRLMKDRQVVAGIQLNAYTLSGKFVEFVTTDDSGKFTFAKLVPEDNMKIKLDSAEDADLNGSMLYLVDGEGVFQRRVVFNGSGEYVSDKEIKEREIIQGFFTKGGSPMLNTALIISDENGYPIDTIYTNDQGKFSYEKLAMDTDIMISPRDMEGDDLDGAELYLVDENGNRTKSYLGQSDETGKGMFVYKSLPFGNTVIKLLDENGDVVETLILSENGQFTYKQLALDNSKNFTLEAENGAELIDGILYLTDSNGKTKRYVVKTGNKAVDMASEGSTKLFGKYEYNKLPAANTAILVIDVNGIVIDTLYTDNLGQFEYDKLNMESDVFFKPIGAEDSEIQGLVYITTKDGTITDELVIGENGFSTANKKAVESSSEISVRTDFHFGKNKTTLSASEQKVLKTLIETPLISVNSKIEIVGHTDDSGTEEINMQVGLARANYIKTVLVNSGIPAKNITTRSAGESEPMKPNSTEEGQRANRRAVIQVL